MRYIKLYEEFDKISKLTKTIFTISEKYIDEHKCDLIDLNNGFCEDIAHDVIDIIGEDENSYIIDDGWFWSDENISDIKTLGGEYWNMNNMEKYGIPPFDINLLSKFDLTGHTWIYSFGKHYDVEAINGVDNFWNLPIFKRQVANIK
jgi:hypothetical protein